MANTEKLKNLMREYGIKKCYYSHGMDLNTERPNGEIYLIGKKNNNLANAAYEIFTEDGVVDENQILLIRVFLEDSEAFKIKIKSDMEVLYADI